MSLHAEKCCQLVSAHAASARPMCSSVRQSLIYSAFCTCCGYSADVTHNTVAVAKAYSRGLGGLQPPRIRQNNFFGNRYIFSGSIG